MNCILKTSGSGWLLLICLLFASGAARSQNSVTVSSPPKAVTILDSTKAQDGLTGSVRRVKTESAKLELKAGRLVEGPRQLVEITTYDVAGKRTENFSYPVPSASVGKEEYEYDARGNIVAMTMKGENGLILSKEGYTYEFDRFGNWTKMITNLVVFEAGELKREPVEVTYRSLTYYFDDSVAKIVESPGAKKGAASPAPASNSAAQNFKERETLTPNQPSTATPVVVLDPPVESKSRTETIAKLSSPPAVEKAPSAEKASAPDAEKASSPPAEKTSPPAVEKRDASLSSQPVSNTRAPAAAEKSVVVPSSPVGERVATPSPGNTASRERTVENSAAKNTTESNWFQLYRTGRDLFDMGDLKGAVDAYLRTIAVEPNSAEVYLSLGHAYIKLEKNKEAAKAFKECVRLNSQLSEAHYGLGLAYFRNRRYADAADSFKRAIALQPKLARAHFGLGMSYRELKYDKGIYDEYKILQTLDPNLAKEFAKTFEKLSLPCRGLPLCQ